MEALIFASYPISLDVLNHVSNNLIRGLLRSVGSGDISCNYSLTFLLICDSYYPHINSRAYAPMTPNYGVLEEKPSTTRTVASAISSWRRRARLAAEVSSLVLKRFTITPSLQDRHSTLYIGTFRAIMSKWCRRSSMSPSTSSGNTKTKDHSRSSLKSPLIFEKVFNCEGQCLWSLCDWIGLGCAVRGGHDSRV